MKAGSLRVLPTAVTPENAPLSDRDGNFQEFLRTFEITSNDTTKYIMRYRTSFVRYNLFFEKNVIFYSTEQKNSKILKHPVLKWRKYGKSY